MDPPSRIPSCASCRHQKRRCEPDCPLVNWFPGNEMEQFKNVYKLYGVANLLKFIKLFSDQPQVVEAMVQSLKFEANARASDPVRGAFGVLQDLMTKREELVTKVAFARTLLKAQQTGMLSFNGALQNPCSRDPSGTVDQTQSRPRIPLLSTPQSNRDYSSPRKNLRNLEPQHPGPQTSNGALQNPNPSGTVDHTQSRTRIPPLSAPPSNRGYSTPRSNLRNLEPQHPGPQTYNGALQNPDPSGTVDQTQSRTRIPPLSTPRSNRGYNTPRNILRNFEPQEVQQQSQSQWSHPSGSQATTEDCLSSND